MQIPAQDRQLWGLRIQVSGEAREEQWVHGYRCLLRPEAGSGYVSVCACRDKGLWCVSAGVFRDQKRAQVCESMSVQRTETVGMCVQVHPGDREGQCACECCFL